MTDPPASAELENNSNCVTRHDEAENHDDNAPVATMASLLPVDPTSLPSSCEEENETAEDKKHEIDGEGGYQEPEIVEEDEPIDNEFVEKNMESLQVNQSIMDAARSKALRPFVIISTSYLLFTVTDGAIRMIVLLHAYNQNFTALEVAIMFTLYELAGVFTNLAAGFLGAKWGIKYTLISGLCLQLFSYGLLFGWKDDWSKEQAIIYVTIAQMFAGIAKDLTKLGGKTVTKLVTPDEQETKLFKLVSLLTGWKNSLKGVGYFLGSALLQASYFAALGTMMGLVLLALPWAVLGLDRNLGTAKKENASSWRQVFKWENTNLTILSIARLFLFASRDFWFEVPLPFFLRAPLCEGLGITECTADAACSAGAICLDNICENINQGGGCGGLGLPRVVVGAFLGGYIILYGQVQSWTPQLIMRPLKQTPPNKLTEVFWGLINCFPTLVATIVMAWSPSFQNANQTSMTIWLVVIIISFAFVFAINSSIHSYLVVKFASKDKIAVSVGLYYMSNALGRLMGTLGSGFLYTYIGEEINEYSGSDAVPGLTACFLAGTLSSLVAALITMYINDNEVGLMCGKYTLVPGEEKEDHDEVAVKVLTDTPPSSYDQGGTSSITREGYEEKATADATRSYQISVAVESALHALEEAAVVTRSLKDDHVNEAVNSALRALEEAADTVKSMSINDQAKEETRNESYLYEEDTVRHILSPLGYQAAAMSETDDDGRTTEDSEAGDYAVATIALQNDRVNELVESALFALEAEAPETDDDYDGSENGKVDEDCVSSYSSSSFRRERIDI